MLCVCVCVCVWVSVYVCVCICVWVSVCMCVCVCMYMYMCMCMCVYVCVTDLGCPLPLFDRLLPPQETTARLPGCQSGTRASASAYRSNRACRRQIRTGALSCPRRSAEQPRNPRGLPELPLLGRPEHMRSGTITHTHKLRATAVDPFPSVFP